MNATEGSIMLSNVSKTYKLGKSKVHAVQNVNLTITAGELLAITGPSGSGKTTLAHIIGGLARPDHGEVTVGGEKLHAKSDRALSRYRNQQAGFIFQSFGLLPHYTALENVMIPLTIEGIGRTGRKRRALKFLELVGLSAQAKQRADTLSGGQRQRVSIARALVQHPQIIIADEPTGSLDSEHGQEIMYILEQLSRKQGITVIYVTHDLALASHASRILTMKDGMIKEVKHAR